MPRQATFIAERQLAATANLGGYFRARLLSFEELGSEILAESGGAALPEITAIGRRMILGHLLRQLQPELRFFRSVATQPGVAAELDSAFSELERAGHGAAAIQSQFTQKSSNPAPASPALEAKLHDLSLIYARYTQFLGGDRQDPNHRLAAALEAIAQCRSLKHAEIFIDSFHDFTGSERKVIAALAKASQSLTITLTLDPASPILSNPHHNPDEMSLFHRCEETYRRLWFTLSEEKIAIEEPVLLKKPRRFTNSQIARLESSAFFASPIASSPNSAGNPHPDPLPEYRAREEEGGRGENRTENRSVYLLEASNPQFEVDAAARWIHHLTTSAKLRYRDIVVLMRTPEDYLHQIESSFHEHNIPFFIDRRRSASHHPLLRFIRATVAVATTNFSHHTMMALLKTNLVGLTDSDTDALENYVLLHGIDHNLWTIPTPWTGRRARAIEPDGEFDEQSLPPSTKPPAWTPSAVPSPKALSR